MCARPHICVYGKRVRIFSRIRVACTDIYSKRGRVYVRARVGAGETCIGSRVAEARAT